MQMRAHVHASFAYHEPTTQLRIRHTTFMHAGADVAGLRVSHSADGATITGTAGVIGIRDIKATCTETLADILFPGVDKLGIRCRQWPSLFLPILRSSSSPCLFSNARSILRRMAFSPGLAYQVIVP